VIGLHFIPLFAQLLSIDQTGQARLWDMRTGAALATMQCDHQVQPTILRNRGEADADRVEWGR
jgi:hypothetical protein